MSDTIEPRTEYSRLLDSDSTYRAATKSGWIDFENQKLRSLAYELRQTEDGLSVGLRSLCTVEEYVHVDICRLNKVHGVGTNTISEIRALAIEFIPDIALDVIQDGVYHAEIKGLRNVEEGLRYHIAVELAALSELVWTRPSRS